MEVLETMEAAQTLAALREGLSRAIEIGDPDTTEQAHIIYEVQRLAVKSAIRRPRIPAFVQTRVRYNEANDE